MLYFKYKDWLLKHFYISDQIPSDETEDDAIRTYWKMFYNSGFTDGLFTNGIRYRFKLVVSFKKKLMI